MGKPNFLEGCKNVLNPQLYYNKCHCKYIHVHEACQQHGDVFSIIFPTYIYDTIAWTDIVIDDGNSLLNVQVVCGGCFFAVASKPCVVLNLKI